MFGYLRHRIAAVAVLAIVMQSCHSTEEYERLARTGRAYTNAVNELLIVAGNIRTDAVSEQLLSDDRIQNQTADYYGEISSLNVERLEIYGRIRAHNQLLGTYFRLLGDLASSNSPESIQASIGSVVSNLNTVGNELRGSDVIANSSVLTSVPSLIVSSQIRGALREELERRKDVIQAELRTQEELMNALSASIEQDAAIMAELRETRLVIRPLASETLVPNEEQWITTRRTLLTTPVVVSQLNDASEAVQGFRELFESFVEGDLSSDRLDNILSDIESFIAIVETLSDTTDSSTTNSNQE